MWSCACFGASSPPSPSVDVATSPEKPNASVVLDDKTRQTDVLPALRLRTTDSCGRSSPAGSPGTPSPRAADRPGARSSASLTTAASGLSGGASARSDALLSGSSSLPRSDASTVGRPQPVAELEALLFSGQSGQRSWSGPPLPGPRPTKARKPTPAKEPPQPTEHASGSAGSAEGRLAWLRRAGKAGRSLTPASSCLLEGLSHPLEGHSHYRVLRQLSSGSSGAVYHCLDERAEEEVAIKLLPRGPATVRAAEREIAHLRLCALHPYIITLREVFVTDSCLALAFEYAPGGNLADYIHTFKSARRNRGLSEERTRLIFQQLIVALEFCHKQGIVNRDIKLENVLLVPSGPGPSQPPIIKLCDFGFSKDEAADSVCKTACGTPECIAPEVLAGGTRYDGKAADVWSLGVLLFTMLTGAFPFSRPEDDALGEAASMSRLFKRIARADYFKPGHLSKPALDLLGRMLQREPAARISLDELKGHPWFGRALANLAYSVNKGLLAMPDSMLTAFANQDDREIGSILAEAAHCEVSH